MTSLNQVKKGLWLSGFIKMNLLFGDNMNLSMSNYIQIWAQQYNMLKADLYSVRKKRRKEKRIQVSFFCWYGKKISSALFLCKEKECRNVFFIVYNVSYPRGFRVFSHFFSVSQEKFKHQLLFNHWRSRIFLLSFFFLFLKRIWISMVTRDYLIVAGF